MPSAPATVPGPFFGPRPANELYQFRPRRAGRPRPPPAPSHDDQTNPEGRMTATGTPTLDDTAAGLAGNWKRFDSFAWFRRRGIADADAWAVIYTHHRDSGLLDQSNAGV